MTTQAPIRTVRKNGEPWFVAKEICGELGLMNPRTSLALLDEDEKGVHSIDTLGGKQEMAIINESGFYALVGKSRKPQAKVFKRWINHDVLPAIRKDGMYVMGKEVAQVLGYADTDKAIRKYCKHPKLFKPADLAGLDVSPRNIFQKYFLYF